jgi:hypothetical protein
LYNLTGGISMEFKSFEKIEKLNKIEMTITQKIHGSNAQILIVEKENVWAWGTFPDEVFTEVNSKFYLVRAGSRNRWVFVGDDNYGFAAFVEANKKELIEKLGVGKHFGEWTGPGINSGEGLTEKTFVLFDWWKFPPERLLPPQCKVVPVLYRGHFDIKKIDEVMEDLKTNGSKLVSGFMRPEGIVIQTMGNRLKKVFDAEETKWTEGFAGPKPPKVEGYDASHLLQPIRLEKLLSKDEKYLREYPESLRHIVTDYTQDLIDEGQIAGTELEIRSVRKAAAGQIFNFIRRSIDKPIL